MTLLLGDPAFLAVAGAVAASGYDSDAQAYITAVESVDGQALEAGVRDAINEFFVGCKADGIWSGIKASCILAGARTREGSLVPLVGTAPTAFGTVGGWSYNRKTGLQGNGTNNYLNSNRNNNADPQNSKHMSVYASTRNSESAVRAYMGASFTAGGTSSSQILSGATASRLSTRVNDGTTATSSGNLHSANGLFAVSRGSSSSYTARGSGNNETASVTSLSPTSNNLFVFARNQDGSPALFADARMSFYSIGENLDPALLDSRVTALMNAFAAAIP